jgi:hypothetical protein
MKEYRVVGRQVRHQRLFANGYSSGVVIDVSRPHDMLTVIYSNPYGQSRTDCIRLSEGWTFE